MSLIDLFKYNIAQNKIFGNRGLFGILPEPSYVGASIVTSFLGYFFTNQILIEKFNLIKQSSKFNKSLLSNKFIYVFVCTFSVFISLSFSSFVTYFLIITLVFIYKKIKNKRFLSETLNIKNLLLSLMILFLAIYYGINAIPNARIFNLYNLLITNPLPIIRGIDQSAADRFNSSFVGFLTPFINPFGYGLNAYPRIFDDCSHPIPSKYNLMCENIFNSRRNNNVLANFTQDGGVFGLITIYSILLSSLNTQIITFRLLIITSVIIFLGIFLPFPLGASIFWILTSLLLYL